MEISVIKTKIEKALKCLVDNDAPLLIYDANERSITHMLAIYLWLEFNQCEYDVDCEYNRNIAEKDEKSTFDRNRRTTEYKKRIFRGKEFEKYKCTSSCDTNGTTVFPDIIIHKRCSNDNLIAIEVKKTTSEEKKEVFDRKKLIEYRTYSKLKYNYSLFIIIKSLDNDEFGDYNKDRPVKIGIDRLELNSNEKGEIIWKVPVELTKEINKEGCRKVSTFL
jgi:hypothetical protein